MTSTNRFSDLVHPELRMGNYVPTLPLASPILRYICGLIFSLVTSLVKFLAKTPPSLLSSTFSIPTLDKSTKFEIYIARPKLKTPKLLPGVIWIHGGGMISGSPHLDLPIIHKYADPHPGRLVDGAIVLAPDYRLAPAHPAPALGDDCFATWLYMVENAEKLGVDTRKIVIAGASAGGGLAALLVQRITDYCTQTSSDQLRPILQILVYPMLDDRTVNRLDDELEKGYIHQSHYPLWDPGCNRFGWGSYLSGQEPNGSNIPARRKDFEGLPPTWIGTGNLDLFHDEDLEYARRLKEAGVEVELMVVKGAWHGFDVIGKGKRVVEAFEASQMLALRKALG